MVKVLPLRLQHYFDPFAMLSVEGSSDTRVFRRLSKPIFRSPYFWTHISYESHLFLQKVKNLI